MTQRITTALLPSAVELVASAFFTNPAHVYVCPDPDRRLARLSWLLGGNLAHPAHLAASFCVAHGTSVDAMGFFTQPHLPALSTLDKIRAGLLVAPIRLGVGGTRRLFEVTRAIDRQLARALDGRRVFYLNNMVVREELRGTGVGTRLLRGEIERLARVEPSWGVALSTQRPENVTFYGRLGFDVALDETIGEGPDAFRNWIMLRPAG